jgi:hypothetical protein
LSANGAFRHKKTKRLRTSCQAAWSAEIPEGQCGPGLSTLCGKLDEFGCPRFEIAEPPRRFRGP